MVNNFETMLYVLFTYSVCLILSKTIFCINNMSMNVKRVSISFKYEVSQICRNNKWLNTEPSQPTKITILYRL